MEIQAMYLNKVIIEKHKTGVSITQYLKYDNNGFLPQRYYMSGSFGRLNSEMTKDLVKEFRDSSREKNDIYGR